MADAALLAARWVTVLAIAVLLLAVTGCGTGGTAQAATADGADPADPAAEADGESGPDRESVVVFGAAVGRLLQVAFYAPDSSFAEGLVVPDRAVEVLAVLDGLVEEVRWAVATRQGETERTWFVSAPLTVEVVELDPVGGAAVVEVWVVTVFARDGLAVPEARFVVETAELEWSGSGWLIAGLVVGPGPGVDLASGAVPVDAAGLDEALSGHELVPLEAGR